MADDGRRLGNEKWYVFENETKTTDELHHSRVICVKVVRVGESFFCELIKFLVIDSYISL